MKLRMIKCYLKKSNILATNSNVLYIYIDNLTKLFPYLDLGKFLDIL